MLTRLFAASLLMTAGLAGVSAQSGAASDPWYRASPKPKDFVAAKLPWDTFTVDLPKDWQLAPGHDGTSTQRQSRPLARVAGR